jgi:NB-ARC domain/APAF-1 helical domain
MEWKDGWTQLDSKGLARFVSPDTRQTIALPSSPEPLSGRKDKLIEEIYKCILEKRVRYATELTEPLYFNYKNTPQLIRSPHEILNAPRQGTCLDLAVLFCGLCLGYKLLPLLIILEGIDQQDGNPSPGHALVAISLKYDLDNYNNYRRENEKCFFEGVLTDAESLKRWIEEESYIAIECTGYAESSPKQLPKDYPEGQDRESGFLDFKSATQAGYAQLSFPKRKFKYALDIACLQSAGMKPFKLSPFDLGLVPREDQGNTGLDKPIYAPTLRKEYYLERSNELRQLKILLLGQAQASVSITSARIVGLQGMGGIGKTILAAAAACDEDIRRHYKDGVFWLTLGQKPDILARQAQLVGNLGGQRDFTDTQWGKSRIAELLANKVCLVILDDVWELEQIEPFDALGERCKLLITSRSLGLLPDGRELPLDVLSIAEAKTLLAMSAGKAEREFPSQAGEIIEECGRLPLALSMIGAMLRKGEDAWERVLRRLQSADLDKIQAKLPNYLYANLLKCIEVSVETLEEQERQCYLDFAVFREDASIPLAVLKVLWETHGLNADDTAEVVDVLVERALVRRDKGQLNLHDLQLDYVRLKFEANGGKLKDLHAKLVDTYQKRCPDGWHTGPNDGYFFENLAYHLQKAEQIQELRSLITDNPKWMQAQFSHTSSDSAYSSDLELALATIHKRPTPDDLLALVRLLAAKQLVANRVGSYTDEDLKTLILLGKKSEALSQAILRSDPREKLKGLMTIQQALQRQDEGSLPELILQAANTIESGWNKANALREIVQGMVEVGQLDQALQAANTIESSRDKDDALREIVQGMVKVGQFEQALQFANTIESGWNKANALGEIAQGMAEVGQFGQARGTFELALQAAHTMEGGSGKDDALGKIAQALVDTDLVRNLLEIAPAGRINVFMMILTNCKPILEYTQPGLFLDVLRRAINVASWTSLTWQKIAQILG